MNQTKSFNTLKKVRLLASLLTCLLMITSVSVLSVSASDDTSTLATGSLGVSGELHSDLKVNGEGIGWSWDANKKTLEITDEISFDYISIWCEYTDDIIVSYSGDVTINNQYGNALYCIGNLTITGSGGLLTLAGSEHSRGLWTDESLTISGGNILVTGENGIYCTKGVTVTGGTITVAPEGENGNGIDIYQGDLTVTDGSVIVSGKGTGYAVITGDGTGLLGKGYLNISGGTVTLQNLDTPENLCTGTLVHTGGIYNGAAAPNPIVKGDVNGDEDVTMRDIMDIQKYIAWMKTFTDAQKTAADVNNDGTVSMRDVMLIQKYIAHMIPSL